jgi:hypothetical protein
MRAFFAEIGVRAFAFLCGAAVAIILAYAIGLFAHPVSAHEADARAGPELPLEPRARPR